MGGQRILGIDADCDAAQSLVRAGVFAGQPAKQIRHGRALLQLDDRAGRVQPVFQHAKGKDMYLHQKREYRLRVLDAYRDGMWIKPNAIRSSWHVFRGVAKKNAANVAGDPSPSRSIRRQLNLSKLLWVAVVV